jgi:DNA-binding transcriptional MerR regulator
MIAAGTGAESEPASVPAMTVVAVCGITYRQLDHWSRMGWIRADKRPPRRPDREAGSGHPRSYPQAEVRIADLIGQLSRAGIVTSVAGRLARQKDQAAIDHILWMLRDETSRPNSVVE